MLIVKTKLLLSYGVLNLKISHNHPEVLFLALSFWGISSVIWVSKIILFVWVMKQTRGNGKQWQQKMFRRKQQTNEKELLPVTW
jgi:hypothetical protein